MGEALNLFKQADLGSLITPSLIGAGVGGLGLGAASYLNSEDDAQGSRFSKGLKGALKGTALGGATGAMVGAVPQIKDILFGDHRNNVQRALADAANSGHPIPPSEQVVHMQHHPIEGVLGKLMKAPMDHPVATGLGGAGAGMSALKAMRAAGDQTYRSAVNMVNAAKPARVAPGATPPTPLQQVSDKLPAANAASGMTATTKLPLPTRILGSSTLRESGPARMKILEQLAKNHPETRSGAVLDPTKTPGPISGAQAQLEQTAHGLKLRSGAADNGNTLAKATQEARRAITNVENPMKAGIKRYGLAGGAGAAGALGLGKLMDWGWDGYLNGKYTPEMLNYWNALAEPKP